MAISITRKEGESFPEYQYRLYENRENYSLSNLQVADLLNKENGTNYDESKFRKEYQIFKSIWEPMFKKQHFATLPEDFAEELAKEQMKMNEKNRTISKMLQDQRREYRKLLDYSARFEHIKNEIFETVKSLDFNPNFVSKISESDTKKELVVMLNDWHFGTNVDITTNKYNTEICKERVDYYLQRTLQEIKEADYEKVNIAALGDFLSGIIHISTRTMANEDLVKQLFGVTELIVEFVANIARITPNVYYYSVVGNHGRIIANKSDVGSHEENFEKMILWYIQARLKEFENIQYFEDKDGLIISDILGETVVYAHGDLDSKLNGAEKIAQVFNVIPKYVFLGHTHSTFMKTHGVSTTIVSSSLIGTDDYASRGRYGGRPAQNLVVFEKTPYGIDHTVKVIHLGK